MAVYFFDKDQTLIKIVPKSGTTEITQTRELPSDDSLMKDTLVVTAVADEKLLDAEYMAVSTVDDNAQSFDMYRIIDDTTPDTTMTFTGMQLGVYELEGKIIQDIRPNNHSVQFTVERLLSGTDWRLGYVADGLPNFTTNFYYISAKEALKSIQALTGAEFVFKVEISGNQITDKWVEVYREMGNRTQKRFNYGTNALTVVRETNKAEVYTALIGRGKGEEVSGAEDNASGQAGYGRKISFKDVTWSKSSGDPLDKPLGQNYLEYPEMTEVFGMKTIDGSMIPRIGVVDFDDEEDPENLLKLTYEQLVESSRPRVLFKTTVANIGETGIGDTVSIHRHDLNIHYQTRVRKVIRNRLNDNKTQIELGDVVFTPSTQRTKNITNSVKNLARDITDTQIVVSETRLTADQKNNVTWGNVEPERKRTGDLWYREHPSITGETQMLIWNGDSWELVLDSSDTNKVAREVERQTAKLNAFTDEIETVRDKADEAIESAGGVASLADRHGELISGLRTDADNALANAGKALDNITDLSQSAQLRFQELSDEIDLKADWAALAEMDRALKEDIEEAYVNARELVQDLDRTLTEDIQEAQSNARELVETAEDRLDKAINLKADQEALESLDQSVNRELEVLDDKLSLKASQITVDSLSDTVTVQKNRLDHTIEGLAFKADREDVDTLERTVTEQGNRITVNEQGLTQKADRSVVDDLNKTVEQQGLELRSTSEGLALKADRSTVNNLSGRVSTAENNIKINADEINRRLTRNEVDNLVDGKGYATQSYVSNSVRETADGINRTIESVERQIPKHYQNRNLLRNSDQYILTTNYLVNEWPITDWIEDGETVTISMMAKSYSRTQEFSFYNTTGLRRMTFFPAGYHDYEVQYWEHTFEWDTNEFNGLTKDDQQTLRLYSTPLNNGFYMEVEWIKLERGDRGTGHTLAPEDLATIDQVSELESTVTRHSTEIDATSQGLTLKADRSDLNALRQTVTQQGADIALTNQGLELKADKSHVDAINQEVSEQGLQISALNDGLALKANQSTVNTLTGRVSSAESRITANANEISRRLTATEVFELMSGQDYATIGYLSNSIHETAEGFKRTIESVERQIPKHYQNRNLLRNSDNYILTTDYLVGEWGITDFIEDGELVTISLMAKAYSRNQEFSFYNTTGSRRMTFFPSGAHDYEIQHWEHTFEWDTNAHNGLTRGDNQTLRLYSTPNNNFYMEILWIKLERGDKATTHTVAPEDFATVTKVNQLESTVDGNTQLISSVRTTANGAVQRSSSDYQSLLQTSRLYERVLGSTQSNIESNISRVVQTSGIIQQEVEALERGLSTRITQTENNISLVSRQVDDLQNTDLISEINIQADRQIFRVGDGRLMLTEDTTYINNNLITNRMLASGITADKITAGTLDASRARIINLDVNSLTGNLANFVQTHWNNISTQISIDNRGINITGSDRWRRTHMNQTGFEFYHGSSNQTKSGVVGFLKGSAYHIGAEENGFIESRDGITRHAVGIGANIYTEIVLGTQAGSANNVFEPSIEIRGDSGDILIHKDIVAGNNGHGLRMRTSTHRGDYGLYMTNKELTRTRFHMGSEMYLEATYGISFYARRGQQNFRMHGNNDSYRNISMHGNRVINESDRRKKRDIEDTLIDSLSAINRWTFVDYNWIDEELNSRQGRQLGLIAQDTPELSEYDAEEDTWHIDNSKQTMMNSHAIQQLSQQTTRQFKTQEDQIFELQQELSKANRRIKELEEAK